MLTTSLIFSAVFFVAARVSALLGLTIRVYMAERVRLEHARDMIGGLTVPLTLRRGARARHSRALKWRET